MKENTLKAVIAITLTALSAYFNALFVPLVVLVAVMIIDYITGITGAYVTRQLSSRTGIIGIIKKICYLIAVAVGMVTDWVICSAAVRIGIEMPSINIFGLLVVVWLILNELISILENLGEIGVPLPMFLSKIIQHLKTAVEKKGDSDAAT